MNGELTARIAAFLDVHHVLSLATVGSEGPHAANVFYARDERLSLFWVSDPASRHSVHIETCPAVVGTVAPDYLDFPEIKGLQLFGSAKRLTPAPEDVHGRQLLQGRYPFLRNVSDAPEALREAFARAGVYRFDPVKIVLIDNSRGFGSKETLEVV